MYCAKAVNTRPVSRNSSDSKFSLIVTTLTIQLNISAVTPLSFKVLNPNVLVSLAAIGVVVMSFAIEYEFASADTSLAFHISSIVKLVSKLSHQASIGSAERFCIFISPVKPLPQSLVTFSETIYSFSALSVLCKQISKAFGISRPSPVTQ